MRVELRLDSFAWEALTEEAARGGATLDELITFSVLYYLADVDSGRISRQISRRLQPTDSRSENAELGRALYKQPVSDRH